MYEKEKNKVATLSKGFSTIYIKKQRKFDRFTIFESSWLSVIEFWDASEVSKVAEF